MVFGDITWDNILNLDESDAANEVCEWVHVGADVYSLYDPGYQLYRVDVRYFLLKPLLVEIACFVCTNGTSLLALRPSSDRLVIFVQEFLSLSNLLMLIKP